MGKRGIGRRDFLRGAGLAALSAAGIVPAEPRQKQGAVPNSSGTEAAKLKAPANACDCHHHIYDVARFPPPEAGAEPNARVAEYRLLQRRIGTTRDVVVTPRPYATDNRVTLDAISQFGANARGVAVIHPTITNTELDTLARGGIRGIRFSLSANPTTAAATSIDMIEPLSKRVQALGWHVQINMDADQIAGAEDLWSRLPSQIVFDHMGHIPQPIGMKHPAFTIIRRLIDKGRTWVKLSVTYDNTKDGPPTYADVTRVAQAYVQAAPERMVWGSNWPHPNEPTKPDDALLFDLLARWAPSAATRRRILVENPEVLYGFAKSA
jgi:predicted TIM-barrel fold metal-dependent hydrolase